MAHRRAGRSQGKRFKIGAKAAHVSPRRDAAGRATRARATTYDVTRPARRGVAGVLAARSGRGADIAVCEYDVTISGPERAVEDFLDAHEIDRRLADPEASRRLPWDQVKTNLGL
jgi:predicted nucleotidyltransferase